MAIFTSPNMNMSRSTSILKRLNNFIAQ